MLAHGSVANEHKSIVFTWKQEEFDQLLDSCKRDEGVQLTLKHLCDKNQKILEAGCGLGRVVKYLGDLGYKQVHGIEINDDAVKYLNAFYPELAIVQGNVLNLPYEKNSFDVVLSYGVIEHFPDGPHAPLNAMYDVLKPGGIALVTVPSFNTLRKMQYCWESIDPRKKNKIRKLFGKKPLHRNRKVMSYFVDPQIGQFYEYRFTKKQFESICDTAGFEIIESKPIAHLDGLFHSPFRPLLKFKNWDFEVTKVGHIVNYVFSKIPFFHNHMHACVLRKK